MEKKKRSPKGLIIALLITAAVILLVRHFHIKNFHIVEPEVLYTSGQPRSMDYTRLLYKYHIATIVNVRHASEHREKNWYNEELTWVKNKSVSYLELPIDRSIDRANYFPDEPTQQEFLKIMSDKANLPVLLHGSAGRKRVPMLVSVWLRKARGYSVEDVARFVEKIKDQPVTKAEREFIENLVE
jgi:protein tyrosine/serine phosphatase